MKQQIPNLLTLSNLICGILSIWYSFNGHIDYAAYAIYTGGIFDFLDGAAARLLKVSGEMGKQLDSMSDMVTFGVAPGFIAYQLFQIYELPTTIQFLVILIPVFSAVRLANFNIDVRQTSNFIGLPTPASGFFWASLVFVNLGDFYPNYLLPTLVVIFSLLLVSEISLFSLKFKSLGWKENMIRYVFLIITLVLFGLLCFKSIPIIVLLYIIISIINNQFLKTNEV